MPPSTCPASRTARSAPMPLLSLLLLSLACHAVAQPSITRLQQRHPVSFSSRRLSAADTGSTSYTAAYFLTCSPGTVQEPASTQEVAAVVAALYKQAQAGTPVTLRVSHPHFHSTASFVCPISTASGNASSNSTAAAGNASSSTNSSSSSGSSAAGEVGLLQTKLNKVLAVDPAQHTMRVGAGMTITELTQAATQNKMSLQIGTVPIYAGLTVGGVLATSAHGTGDMAISTFADTVLEVTWVDGTGTVHVSKKDDPEFTAFPGSLGVFGVMTELLLQLTPSANAQLTTVKQNDRDMEANIEALLKVSPHMMIMWRPDAGSYNAYLLKEAPTNATVDTNPAIEMSLSPSTKGEALQDRPFKLFNNVSSDDSSFFALFCPAMKQQMLAVAWASVGSGAGAKRLANVTAPVNQLSGAECGEYCGWNNNNQILATAMDVEFTIEYDQLAEWIADVKAIFQKDLYEGGAKKYRCMGPGAMWVRFGAPCEGVTATPCGLKRPVYVQSTWLRSRDPPDYPLRYQFVADLIEELTVCKFKGRPHWGKNADRTFLHPRCPITPLYPKFDTLLSLAQQHDPAGMFRTRLFDNMVAGDSFETSPQCAPKMKCYCSADIHCRPGDTCVPSLAFPDYKVCKPANGSDVSGSIVRQVFR